MTARIAAIGVLATTLWGLGCAQTPPTWRTGEDPTIEQQVAERFIQVDLKHQRVADGLRIIGFAQNKSGTTVFLLRVRFTAVDAQGRELGRRDDLCAHNLPVGDNKGSIMPGERKPFRTFIPLPAGAEATEVRTRVLQVRRT